MSTTPPDLLVEQEWCEQGVGLVAGMDEVGRGALAGPVTVGVAVVTPESMAVPFPVGLTDSKMLSAAARARIEPLVKEWVHAWGVGSASAADIDAHGIIAALRLAGERALLQAQETCGPVRAVVLDGKHDWLTRPERDLFTASDAPDDDAAHVRSVRMVVKGDLRCASVSAASVLAKCVRDREMIAAHAAFPDFGWEGNKGYGSAEHLAALRRLGPCDLHRRSWALPDRETVRLETVG